MSMPSLYGNPPPQQQSQGQRQQQPQYPRPLSQGHLATAQSQPDYSSFTSQPPSFATHPQTTTALVHGHMQSTQNPIMSTTGYQSRGYEDAHPDMSDLAKDMPEITSVFPREGSAGSNLTIILHSSSDLVNDPRTFNIMFGSRRVKPTLTRQSAAHGIASQYALSALIPPLQETGWFSNRVNVYLNAEDRAGEELGTLEVGIFEYTDGKTSSYTAAGTAGARKRKSSPDDADTGEASSSYIAPPRSAPPNPSPPTSSTGQPILVRTSSLAQASQSQDPSTIGSAGPTGQPFNPYGIYPNKAILKIVGDLDSMAQQWTAEEWDNRRRLVQFWRQQKGSAIHTMFQAVPPNERQANSICISCIWWAEKSECFVTSVDTIYLLESLIGVRFTVEEKNRIRRNLEGFRPLTVSKAKQECESFFKLIMAFPNPKPRNIEKDVKVFPWKILSHALKKIIGKYSASYSSTASALLPSGDYPSGSPSRSPGLSTSTPPTGSITSPPLSEASIPTSRPPSGPSPLIQQTRLPPSNPPYVTGPPDLQLHVPATLSAPSAWQQAAATTVGGSRQSFDLSAFLETSPQTATPSNQQSMHYQRGGMMSMDSKDDLTRRHGRP